MVKSMYAAVAGLKTHQSKMDVISNNIANVNTWGYKAMTASFKESMYQQLSSGSAGSTNDGAYGAVNPTMMGYGSVVSAISANFTKGSPAPTDRGLDLFIDGTAFFMVGPIYGDGEEKNPSDVYMSRVGDFEVRNGYLVDSNGRYVYGCAMSEGGILRTIENNSTEDTTLTKLDFRRTKEIRTATKTETAGSYIVGDMYNVNGKDYKVIKVEGTPDGKEKVTYALEDIPAVGDEFEYQTGKKGEVIAVSADVPPVVTYSIAPKPGDMYSAPDGTKGEVISVTPNADDPTKSDVKYAKITSTTITYDGPAIDNMEFDSTNGGYKMTNTETLKPLKIPTTCQYWDEETESYITENNVTLTDFSINAEGMIYGSSEASGKTYMLGCVALVNVLNPNGMTKSDGPYYQLGGSAGEAQIIAAGGDTGSLRSGYLEMANVDIANEFSNMITTQRGFQANSKIISVTDEMLQELVNMKR